MTPGTMPNSTTIGATTRKAWIFSRQGTGAASGASWTVTTRGPNWTVETVFEVLRSATEEYEEALEDGRIANVVEYQDARGFVLEAERLFATVADELARKDAQAVDVIRASLDELKAAFPSPMPPERAVKETGALLSSLSRIELQLGRLR